MKMIENREKNMKKEIKKIKIKNQEKIKKRKGKMRKIKEIEINKK